MLKGPKVAFGRDVEGNVPNGTNLPNSLMRRLSIDLPNTMWRKEHVLLYKSTTSTSDDYVPEIQKKLDRWDELVLKMPGFTRAMVVVSDLVYYTNGLVIDDLNEALLKRGAGETDFVIGVLYRLNSRYVSESEKMNIVEALGEVFGAGTFDDSLRTQWKLCWSWKNKILLFAHPLRNMTEEELGTLKTEIENGSDYNTVRGVANLMVNMLISIFNPGCAFY